MHEFTLKFFNMTCLKVYRLHFRSTSYTNVSNVSFHWPCVDISMYFFGGGGGGGGGGGWDGSGLRQKTYNDVGMTHSYGHHVTFLLYNIR